MYDNEVGSLFYLSSGRTREDSHWSRQSLSQLSQLQTVARESVKRVQTYWLVRVDQFIEVEPSGSKDEYSSHGYAGSCYVRLDFGSLTQAQSLPLAVFILREKADAFADALDRATALGKVHTSERFFSAQLLLALHDALTDIEYVALDPAPELVAHAALEADKKGLGTEMIALLTIGRREFMDLLLGSLIHLAAVRMRRSLA